MTIINYDHAAGECQPLIIMEGADGCGKTRLAQDVARSMGALYVHFGPMKGIKNLARFYLEAMQPALLGLQAVVMDRSWLSELPYGTVFRGGQLRVDHVDNRMLERVAHRCNPLLVRCQPKVETMIENFEARACKAGGEYLTNRDQLLQVAVMYDAQYTSLRTMVYDYEAEDSDFAKVVSYAYDIDAAPGWHHGSDATAGVARPRYVIVGESFAAHKEYDSLYQYPFVSFSNQGCSRWLTRLLDEHRVMEDSCYWVNADQISSRVTRNLFTFVGNGAKVIAFGSKAAAKLREYHLPFFQLKHPMAGKRFGMTDEDLADFRKAVDYVDTNHGETTNELQQEQHG